MALTVMETGQPIQCKVLINYSIKCFAPNWTAILA